MIIWKYISRIILNYRIIILLCICTATYFLSEQAQKMEMSYTEANMLPNDHKVNIQYDEFLKIFGEEGNLIILAVKDASLFTPKKFNEWNAFADQLNRFSEVDNAISIGNLKALQKDKKNKRFILTQAYKSPKTQKDVIAIQKELFERLPFYDNLLFNKHTQTVQTILYIDKEILNKPERKDFIFDKLIPAIEKFENESGLDVHVSGMPYIRSLNSQNILDEIGIFVFLALAVTALIFFFFFRSFRATFITLLVVSIGVTWACGFIGLFGYKITVLTGLIPPLIIVIGVPNAIFLINKYQQEIKKHGDKRKSLTRVISRIGNATLMTNITTSAGFFTFFFTRSQLLREFGVIAAVSIMGIFILSLLIIPTIYSLLPLPSEKHLRHLEKRWMHRITRWMVNTVRHRKVEVYTTAVALVIISIVGLYTIKVSGSLIEDMPKGKEFFKDILFFEREFGGIMPLEILIDTKKDKGVMKLSTLKRMEKIHKEIEKIPELSKPISIVNLVKYAKQAYYNGNPKYYQLPTSQEKSFILPYIKNSEGGLGSLKGMIDSTGRYARITTFMKDVKGAKMDAIQKRLRETIDRNFSPKRYTVSMTGKALIFFKGTRYLINNLVLSLSLAILLISVFMGSVFKSVEMIIISLVPNILPILVTAGLMGYLGIPIKPSTILVFSIAFGISVDDTIHFLEKYRQELTLNNTKPRLAIYKAIRETGVSMFYTSTVLFFGFLVFIVSSFGGTKALGGLVSITLLFAMVSNLLLLPSLLLTFDHQAKQLGGVDISQKSVT